MYNRVKEWKRKAIYSGKGTGRASEIRMSAQVGRNGSRYQRIGAVN